MSKVRRWDVLADLINKHGFKKCAEIGVKSGKNLFEVCSRCPDVSFLAIDPWEKTEDYKHWTKLQIARHEKEFSAVQACFPDRIAKIKAYSVDASKYVLDESLDLVFIDGDHTYESVKADIACWLPKIRKGGIICGHDYNNTNKHGRRFIGVDQAVDEAFGDNKELYQDHVWAVQV